MPLAYRNLDDWTYDDLVAEGRRLIPVTAPEWTNHNASDPGITLLELFAYFTEMLIFQTAQITDQDQRAFLRLLNGPDFENPSRESLAAEMSATAVRLKHSSRAVTREDFETLALEADGRAARAKCLPERNLEERNEAARQATRPGHVSVVVVPRPLPETAPVADSQTSGLLRAVRDYLEPRKLLTTRIHVVLPRFVKFGLRLRFAPIAGVSAQFAEQQVRIELERYFDPLRGGRDGQGWPFGRSIFLSEIYEIVSKIPCVDFVTRPLDPDTSLELDELQLLDGVSDRMERNGAGEFITIRLGVDELPAQPELSLQIFSLEVTHKREL